MTSNSIWGIFFKNRFEIPLTHGLMAIYFLLYGLELKVYLSIFWKELDGWLVKVNKSLFGEANDLILPS